MVANAVANSKKVEGNLSVERQNEFSARCTWTIPDVKGKIKQKAVWSKYFDVGGYDCRLLLYPGGDSQALPGYISVYLQITDPTTTNAKWECFTSYRLRIENKVDAEKSISRDSWHRFSPKKKSHGWCDFTPSQAILDSKSGFCVSDSIVVSADILLLKEEYTFQRDPEPSSSSSTSAVMNSDVLAGKFTWKVHNISMFMEVMSMQKIMSPVFPAGGCQLRLSVYQSMVNDVEYLSMCLESKDADKASGSEKSCWCLFRMSVLSHKEKGGNHMLRDSYGRFAGDARTGDNTSLGWNDYMLMGDFFDPDQAYVSPDGTAVFSTSFHIIKESSSFVRLPLERPLGGGGKARKGGGLGDGYQGKFTWKIENFTKLKDLLKKRKITSLCIKSRRFQVGGKDCRLIVYPRGQSQPPMHLSMFLEVTDPRNQEADWSCFVSHRLSVINQHRDSDKSVSKESQNRYSKAAKDWGWREFVTLTSLFDTDLGFLVSDTVVLCAEVLILKESCEVKLVPLSHDSAKVHNNMLTSHSNNNSNSNGGHSSTTTVVDTAALCPQIPPGKKLTFTWKIDNFLAFKEILETRKIFSKFFTVGGCDLRIGVYESFDTLCIYLESEAQSAGDPQEGSFWVQYRIAAVSQKKAELTEWKDSSICTRAWNNSVLQFIKVPDMLSSEKGYFVKDSIVLACDILECTPWLEFGDTDLTFSEPDLDAVPAVPPLPWPLDEETADTVSALAGASETTAALGGPAASTAPKAGKESAISRLLNLAGLQLTTAPQPEAVATAWGAAAAAGATVHIQVVLQEKLAEDEELLQSFCNGMRAYLQDPVRVHRLARTSVTTSSGQDTFEAAPSLMELLLSVHILQQPLLDLMLSVLLSACEEHAAALPHGAAAPHSATPPPLIARNKAAELAAQADPSALASRWDAICSLSQTSAPNMFASAAGKLHSDATDRSTAANATASTASGANTGSRGSTQTTHWSPASLFALMQPHRFLTHYHALAPTMILASGRTPSGANSASTATAAAPSSSSSASSSSTAAPDSKQHIRELVAMISGVAKTADPWTLASERAANPSLGIPVPTADDMRRIMLLAPPELLPYIAMVVPVVLDPGQHTMAAGVLLAALADTSQASPEAEAELQVPVCTAIGMLQIAPAIAAPTLKEALEALSSLPKRDLPGAIALITKLANEVPAQAPAAVRAVRERVNTLGPEVPLGVLQAMCLAVLQHHEVASALLQDITEAAEAAAPAEVPVDATLGATADGLAAPAAASSALQNSDVSATSKAAADGAGVVPHINGNNAEQGMSSAADFAVSGDAHKGVVGESSGSAGAQNYLMEIELLIEIMMIPHLRDDAESIFELCVSKGLVTADNTALLLERRRMQHIMFKKLASQLPHNDAAAQALWRRHLASVLSWPKNTNAPGAAGAAAAARCPPGAAVGAAGMSGPGSSRRTPQTHANPTANGAPHGPVTSAPLFTTAAAGAAAASSATSAAATPTSVHTSPAATARQADSLPSSAPLDDPFRISNSGSTGPHAPLTPAPSTAACATPPTVSGAGAAAAAAAAAAAVPSGGGPAGGALPWTAPTGAVATSGEASMSMDDDDFNVLLDLAAWLSHTSSPAAQQYTFRLYLHIFSLWPQQQGRVRMIQALTHRTASFASICNHSDPNQLLLPVQAGSIESRVLICLMEGWPQYAPVALLCMLDLLGKQSNAYMVQCMQKQMTADELAKANEEVTALKGHLTSEQEANTAQVEELEAKARRAAQAATAKQTGLQEDILSLQEQVVRLEAELRQARQAGDAAENKATAAAKDLRQLGSLEEEVRRLRSQALANDKRRTKDTKSLKDAEARASTLDMRLSERDSQVEALQKQLAAAQAEHRKTAAKLDGAANKVTELEKELLAQTERCNELCSQMEAQADELSKLQEERATQRILLPPGMEEEFDAPMPQASPRKGGDAVTSDGTRGGGGAGAGAFSGAAGPSLLGHAGAYPDYKSAFSGGPAPGATPREGDGGSLALSGFSGDASSPWSAAAAAGGKGEHLLHGLGGRGSGRGSVEAGLNRVGRTSAAAAVSGINPAAKPFVASRGRNAAGTANTATRDAGPGMHGGLSRGLGSLPQLGAHDSMHESSMHSGGMNGLGMGGGGPPLPPRQSSFAMPSGQPLMSLGFFESPGPDGSGGQHAAGSVASGVHRKTNGGEPLGQNELLVGDVLRQGSTSGTGPGSGTGRGTSGAPPLMQQGSSVQMPTMPSLPPFMMGSSAQKQHQNIWGRPPGAPHY